MKPTFLRIAQWNANGLLNHIQEIIYFLKKEKIDILLISESHLTDKSFINIPGYKCYHTLHPTGAPRGGSSILAYFSS